MQRRNFALLLRYDGSAYKGWQPQANLRTVGGELTAALRRLGIGASPYGASRTDAGVHARAQVASFTSRGDLDAAALAPALNRELPADIRVLAAREVPKSFHAHWSSIGKQYRYRISFTGGPRAWRLPTELCLIGSLDRTLLERALERLRAAPDLSAFCADKERRIRTVARLDVLRFDAGAVELEIEGPGFGKYMVRKLISAAVEVAGGRVPLDDLDGMLAGTAPRPWKAPADGLTLHRVLYPMDADPFSDVDPDGWPT